MLAHPEADVRVRIAIDPEREAVGEHVLVAVGGGVEQAHGLVLPHGLSANRVVARGSAGELNDGRRPAHDLLDRRVEQAGFARSFRHSAGFSSSASRPPVIALRVVSLPATTSRK
jgi:hypothetical protein